MSEIAFWVSPWPSVWMNFVTLGHFLSSSCASAVVMRRQLLAAKPSASANVIFLLPNQAGRLPVDAVCVLPESPDPPDPPDPPLESLPHAATVTASASAAAPAATLATCVVD